MSKGLKVLAIFLVVTFVSGCLPRGETRTLEQVYTTARDEFMAIGLAAIKSAERRESAQSAITALESLVAVDSDKGATAQQLATSLRTLTNYAGYTSRASLAELAAQLEVISAAKADSASPAALKLIAARVYNVFTSELSGTAFGVV